MASARAESLELKLFIAAAVACVAGAAAGAAAAFSAVGAMKKD